MTSLVLETQLSVLSELPLAAGFKNGTSSAMTSRTMMLAELRLLLAALPASAGVAAYRAAIVDDNLLLKRSATTRRATAKHLVELYALDPAVPVFRLLRRLWDQDEASHPVLACLCANARDALLRCSAQAVLPAPHGTIITPEMIGNVIGEAIPERFSRNTLGTIARNAASSWTQSGHVGGHRSKRRACPTVTPAGAAYALALGYLAGARGAYLFETYWTAVLDRPAETIDALAFEAGRQGWLTYRRVGDVVDLRFSELLDEERSAGA
jgi:hypothetical protein